MCPVEGVDDGRTEQQAAQEGKDELVETSGHNEAINGNTARIVMSR